MIFNFNNINDYILSYIRSLKDRRHGEIGRLARAAEVSSTFMSQALSGKKTLSLEQAQRLTQYLHLNELESEYFFELLLLERAGTAALKSHHRKRLAHLKKQSLEISKRVETKKSLTDEERTVFYSDRIYSMVRLYTSTAKNGRLFEEIQSRFQLSEERAKKILDFLLHAGLVAKNDAYYLMGPQSTHLESTSPHLGRHLTNWRLKALEQQPTISPEELLYSSLVSLSKDDFGLLREELVQVIKRFLDKVHSSPAEEIACLNIDWFWVK